MKSSARMMAGYGNRLVNCRPTLLGIALLFAGGQAGAQSMYKYQDEDIDFYSSLARSSLEARRKQSSIDPFTVDNYLLEVDQPVVVPKGSKVRLLLTSNDFVWPPL